MSNVYAVPHSLGSLLRYLRDTTKPSDVGIQVDPYKPRRVTGLLCDEVADLAGISAEWYRKIEQGRGYLSLRSLNRLADALRLDTVTKSLLIGLADFTPDCVAHLDQTMLDYIQILLDDQRERPAYVTDETWDTLMWNHSTCAIFGDYNLVKPCERNVLWMLFQDPIITQRGDSQPRHLSQILGDCASHARNIISLAKVDYIHHPTTRLHQVVDELLTCNPYFRECWHDPQLETNPHITKTLHHSLIGKFQLQQIVVQLAQYPNIRIVQYVAQHGTDQLKLLDLYQQI